MKIAIIDYETGNLKSVSKALELASNNVLKRSNIEVINLINITISFYFKSNSKTQKI